MEVLLEQGVLLLPKMYLSNTVVGGNLAKVITTVDEYMKKCKKRNVLYKLPDYVLKKHGTEVRLTDDESKSLIKEMYIQI